MKPTLLALFAMVALAACHDDGSAPSDQGISGDGAVSSTDGGGNPVFDLASSCGRVARADDATRYIVVSHPFAATTGDKSPDFELLTLPSSGTITQPKLHFQLGIANSGDIVFTPDGQFGYVVEDDGSIGIFRISSAGMPTVVQAAFIPGFSASRLWVSPSGDQLYGLDSETSNNHGGVYQMTIACDGTLNAATLLSAADLPYAALPLASGNVGLYAHALSGAAATETVHLVTLGPPFQRQASAVGFADATDEAIVAGAASTTDGRYLLFGDNSQFSSVDNRITVVEVTSTGMRFAQLLTPVLDPVSIVASPYGNAMLVSSGFENAFLTLAYDAANATTPFLNKGPITYLGAKPELPGTAIAITRGTLKGKVYVGETLGIRQLRFETNGSITDLGKFSVGTGKTAIVGTIGITP